METSYILIFKNPEEFIYINFCISIYFYIIFIYKLYILLGLCIYKSTNYKKEKKQSFFKDNSEEGEVEEAIQKVGRDAGKVMWYPGDEREIFKWKGE